MPFEFRNYWLLLRLALEERMTPQRRRVAWLVLIAIPLLAALNGVCLLFDRMLFPGYRRTRIDGPVFIIGHARSGTTLTHQLFARDPRFSWFMTWELAFPSILQKKLIRLAGALDRRFLDSRIAKAIGTWEDRVFAKGRQMHPMGLTLPEEDEFILVPSVATSYLANIFPYMKELRPWGRHDDWPDAKRRQTLAFYRECIRRHTYLNGGDKIHLCKMPLPAGKLKSLHEYFPDARYVVNLRHPYQTIPSLQKLMWRNWKASEVEERRIQESLDILLEQSFEAYRAPLEFLDAHPELPRALLDYRELTTSPRKAIERVYAELGFDVGPELERALAEEDQVEHRADHRYTLDEFNITREQIHRELEPLFRRFDWDPQLGADGSRAEKEQA